MEISLSDYKLNNLFDLELDRLTIISKNKSFRIFVKKSRISILNWFIFIILIIYICFINCKYTALFFNFFSKFVEKKIATLKLDEIEIYHLKREESSIKNFQELAFINFVFSYFDFELYNVRLLSECKLLRKTFLFGTNIGTIYKRNNPFGKTSIFVRRISVRFNEYFDDISIFDIINLIGLKKCFFSTLNDRETILAFPGLLNIDIINSNNSLFATIIEDNIEWVYSGIYLSIPLLNYIFINIKSLYINKNGNCLIQNMFNWKLEILINFKRIFLETYESRQLFLTISSIMLTLEHNLKNNFSLLIKLLNCYLLINLENSFKILELNIYFDTKSHIIKANINNLRLYSRMIHSDNINSFIDVIEIPEISLYTCKIKHCKESLSVIFFSFIELNSELLIIKSTGLDEIPCESIEFKKEISNLLEFPDYLHYKVSNNEGDVYSIFYTPLERTENKNLNIQINFNFNSNIQLIYNMSNIELNVENSKLNLTFNSNEKFLNITDFELAHYNYLYEKVFYIKVKSILFVFESHNQNLILKEMVAEKENKICIFSNEISISKTGNSYKMNASRPIIYLFLNNSLNFNSIVFETDYINFIFQKSIYCWESIEIYNITIKQSFSKDESLLYELIRIDEGLIKISNENISEKNLTIYIPKLLLAVNNYQIIKLVDLVSYFKKNSVRRISRTNQLNLIITSNNTSIHYYNHIENKCTTLLTHFQNGIFVLSMNNLEVDINSKINRIEIMAGEIRMDNDKFIKLPHYNETFYSKLHCRNIYCDIVYYEIVKKVKTYAFTDKNETQNSDVKEKIFPIFISNIDISHNIHIKLRENTKMKVHYSLNKDSILESSNSVNDEILILINAHDYVNSNKLFSFNNFGDDKYKLLKFLEKVNDICLFEIRFQCLNMLLMKTQFETKYLIFNFNNILFSNFNSFELFIEKFKILVKHSSNHFSGECLNVIINNNLIKANLKILDSKMVFYAERLIFNLNFLTKEFECQIELVKFNFSKNLVNLATDIVFNSALSHQGNELYSVKYYQGANSFYYLSDMRQSPAFINNLMLLSNEEVSLFPYFHINCLSNAKFNMRKIEVPLFYDSIYFFDLNNSFFDKIYSSYSQPYYSRYFNDNIYSLSCKIDLGDINVNNNNSEISHFNFYEFSTNSVTVGLKICFSSKVFNDLILFFGPKIPINSNIFERAIKIRKNQKIEIPFDLIAVYPNLMVFRDINTINGIDYDLLFTQNNSINIIGVIKNVMGNSETYYFNYNLINSSLCIGFEFIHFSGSCININIFNTVSIINVSGESLHFSLFNVLNKKLEYVSTIENLRHEFIENINTNIDTVLLIKDPMEITNQFYVEFNKVRKTESHSSINDNIIELNEIESQINNKNYRLSLVKDNISFFIIVWSPLIILNYSNLKCILKIIDIESQEYYIIREKISKNNLRNSTIKKNFNNKSIFSFATIDQTDFAELKIHLGCYSSKNSLSKQRENNILIEIQDYKHLIKNNFILSILERYSIQIKVVKLIPLWIIRNKSDFNIKITYGKYVNIPIKSNTGYLDNTNLICGANFNYDIQEQIKITFDEFINFFLINLTKDESYEKLMNLYPSDKIPNKEWKLVKISFYPLKDGSLSDFNTGIYIELNNFNESESNNYFIFENKTSFTYLLTQTNDFLDFNSLEVNIPRRESLTQKIWEKTLIEKFSKFPLYDSSTFKNKYSICLVPEQIDSQLFFWAKDSIQDNNSPVTVSFYDNLNDIKVILEQIPTSLYINGGTKPIRFTYYDSNGNNNLCQFLLSIFRFENEVTHIVFHESSYIQTYYTIIRPFFIQKQSEYQLTVKEEIKRNCFLNITKFELALFSDTDSDQVLKVKWSSTPKNSPKGSNKNLSLIPSPRRKHLIDFFPIFHIFFEQISIKIQEEENKFNLFDLAYKVHSNSNKFCCKISNYETIIFEANNKRDEIKQGQVTLNLNFYKLKKRVNNKPKFSKKYQIQGLMFKIPSLNFNLNLNVYFRNFFHNFVTENQVNLKRECKSTNNECLLIIDIFPYELHVNELLINRRLRINNLKHFFNSPKNIVIDDFNSIVNLSKQILKNATYITIRTLLNKSINPLVYF
ncbi:uncharacterized protein ELE39_000708 [Cryptosporidium sp. chipmunk genotype I]|uniref:uncharacterized protein n=1 Tax=Cryptosporidium sp. chipmunk genotype I TaxID=1280935 RepID=UPI00351A0381|nr:hypothetical protein ELE39_000708 [Cryptosporidium sp. chipmunk genotype I]